jgi:short-subunit dehydrogenase involved in D-alanine esterification of teichoic acids
MKIDNNTVVLITGGASGLGEASAKKFIEKGCKVIIADMNEENG